MDDTTDDVFSTPRVNCGSGLNEQASSSTLSNSNRPSFITSRIPKAPGTIDYDEDVDMVDFDANVVSAQRSSLPQTTINDLPEKVINKILKLAGLPNDTRINLNYGRSSGDHIFPRDEWWFYSSRPYPNDNIMNILLTSRKFYRMGVPIIYGENHVVIHWRNGNTLSGLVNLSDLALSSIRKMLIILNNSAPIMDIWALQNKDSIEHHRLDEPLSTRTIHYQDLAEQWERVVARLSLHMADTVTWLDFICDCADSETAYEITEPLLQLPQLRHSFIRLSHRVDSKIQAIAREAALRTVHRPHDSYGDPFPYLRLPREIRLHVLNFTDLVTPQREVEWNDTEKYHLRTLGNTVCKRCKCHECPGGDHPKTLHWFLWGVRGRYARTFCSRYCSAFEASSGRYFSPISQTCLCWRPPSYLFLICRDFLADARETFYKRNRFIIKPSGDLMKPALPSTGRTEISHFLGNAVPSTALHALRHVEIVYPFFEANAIFSRMTDAANQDLRLTLDAAKGQLNLQALTICIHMADYTTWQDSDKTIWLYSQTPPEQTDDIMKNHIETVKCYTILAESGLEKFFVRLHRPWNWWMCVARHDIVWQTLDTRSYSKTKAAELAAEIEHIVMGNGYDSMKMGKAKLLKPMWKKRLEDMRP